MIMTKRTVRVIGSRNIRGSNIVKVRSTPNSSKIQLARWVGFCDAMAGYSYRKEYETWEWRLQENYERGRQEAIEIKTCFGRMTWAKTSTMWTAAKRRFGDKVIDVLVPIRDLFVS